MKSTGFFQFLDKNISINDQKDLFESIKLDPIIWTSFTNLPLIKKITDELGFSVENWTLGKICLIEAGLSLDILSKPIRDKLYLKKAISLFENSRINSNSTHSLEDATLLALALYERGSKTKNWKGILNDLGIQKFESRSQFVSCWRTPLAILYSFLGNHDDLLFGIASDPDDNLSISLINHIVAIQLLPKSEKANTIKRLVEMSGSTKQISWYQSFPTQLGFMINEISEELHQPFKIQLENEKNVFKSFRNIEDQIQENVLSGYKSLLENSNNQAHAHFVLAKNVTKKLHDFIDLLCLESDNDPGLISIDSKDPFFEDILISNYGNNIELNQFKSDVDEPKGILLKLSSLIDLKNKGENLRSKELGNREFEFWLNQRKNNWPAIDEIELIQRIDHQKLISSLKELDLNNLIEKYVRFLEDISKNNANINPVILDAINDFMDTEDQYEKYKVSRVVSPQNKNVQKNLIKLLSQKKDWETLFDEYEIAEKQDELDSSDWVKYAFAACNAGELETAIRLYEKLSTSGADSGQTLSIQGRISFLQGDYESAKTALLASLNTSTDLPDAWLTLAEIYEKEENFEETVSTLRSAVLAVPDSDEIHFALASSCLKNNHFTEALPYLRKAIALNPENADYYVSMVISLKELGHFEEANSTLTKGRMKWPTHGELAFLDAKRSLDNNDREQGIAALKDAIQNADKPSREWLLLYAKTLLNDDENQFTLTEKNSIPLDYLATAQKVLQNIVKIDGSRNTYAKLLLAEVFYVVNEIEAAHSIYVDLVNSIKTNSDLDEWNWRIFAGMGMAKIALHENEIGLVMLKDAVTKNPAHIGIKHALAETLLNMNLEEDGITIAKDAYLAGSTDVRNLVWYSDFMKKVNETEEVIKALENANLLSNYDEAISLRLAKEYVSIGNIQSAGATLDTLMSHDLSDYGFLREITLTYLRLSNFEKSYLAYKKALVNLHQLSLENQIEFIYLCYLNEKWQETLDHAQRLITQNYNFVSTYVIQAESLVGLSQNNQALSAYEQAIQSKRKLSDYLKFKNSHEIFVPIEWISGLEKEEMILTKISVAAINSKEFERSLKCINQVIQLQPDVSEYKILGADVSLQMNDFETAKNYLESVNLDNSIENNEILYSLQKGLNQILDHFGKNTKISDHEMESKNLLVNMVDVAMKVNDNDFIGAREGFLRFLPTELSETLLTVNGKMKPWIDQVWRNTFFRLAIMNAIDLYEFSFAEDLLNLWTTNKASSVETSFYKLLLIERYEMINPMFLASKVEKHRSENLEKMMNDKNQKYSLLNNSSSQGKSSILKDFEKAINLTNNVDLNYLQLTVRNQDFPGFLKFIFIDRLLQLGQLSEVEQYLVDKKSTFIDFHTYTRHLWLKEPQKFVQTFLEKTFPFDPIISEMLSLSFANLKNYEQAIFYSEKALEIWSDEELWKVENALLLEKMGDSKGSFVKWEKILQETDSIQNVIFPYLDVLIRNGRSDDVLKLLNQHKTELNNEFEYHFYTAMAYFIGEKYDSALQSIQEAKDINPENLNIKIIEGKIFLSMKQIDRAKQIANSVIQKDKNFVDGYLLLVSIYESQKKFLDAERIIEEALSFNPNHHELLINKVWIQRELGNLPEALKVASQMSIDNPNDWEAFSLLALLYNDLEDYRTAEENAKKSMRINSDQPEIMMLLGQILKKQGQLDQAIEYFSKAAIATPTIIDPCIEIGDIYFDQQNFPDALDAYQEAINRKENDARPYFKAGLIMKEVKDYQGAEKMMKIAASFAPKDSNIRRQLAGVIALNFVHSPLEAK